MGSAVWSVSGQLLLDNFQLRSPSATLPTAVSQQLNLHTSRHGKSSGDGGDTVSKSLQTPVINAHNIQQYQQLLNFTAKGNKSKHLRQKVNSSDVARHLENAPHKYLSIRFCFRGILVRL